MLGVGCGVEYVVLGAGCWVLGVVLNENCIFLTVSPVGIENIIFAFELLG
jgi:hypothetical protein